ncbi:hypothetical protein L228DRAFT_249108 [Xylona heveae TC161]|uniref:F-box domain-containing protein n=1 Tax=Xylona heveae (strain CBS 132557 / TC161) TaxID=1328760 RepID=A0A165FRW3_XYLHT|nr:hypothetical protein L228DRAFT_249108 [Xylona heveae TC161]KZF21302.1 hypothetical protein L228DRAFT_249108 [Xylona heveae TC161]
MERQFAKSISVYDSVYSIPTTSEGKENASSDKDDKEDMERPRGLLSLPSEIRCEIYWYLLCSHSHPIVFPRPSTIQGNSLIATEPRIWTAILSTCRVVYEEALPILYGQNFFWYTVPGGFGARASRYVAQMSKEQPSPEALDKKPACTPDLGIAEKFVPLLRSVTIDRVCFGSEFNDDDDIFLAKLIDHFTSTDLRLTHFQFNLRSYFDVWSVGPQLLPRQSTAIAALKRMRSVKLLSFFISGSLKCDQGLIDDLCAAWNGLPFFIYDHGVQISPSGQNDQVRHLPALAWLTWGTDELNGLTELFLYRLG